MIRCRRGGITEGQEELFGVLDVFSAWIVTYPQINQVIYFKHMLLVVHMVLINSTVI